MFHTPWKNKICFKPRAQKVDVMNSPSPTTSERSQKSSELSPPDPVEVTTTTRSLTRSHYLYASEADRNMLAYPYFDYNKYQEELRQEEELYLGFVFRGSRIAWDTLPCHRYLTSQHIYELIDRKYWSRYVAPDLDFAIIINRREIAREKMKFLLKRTKGVSPLYLVVKVY